MKRKLLLAALCVVGAIGGGNSLMAQTDVTSQYLTNEGWTEVTELPSADELTNFYYVLVATEKDLMVAQEQNYEQESQLTLVYRNFLNPFTWKRVVWSIEYDDTHLYSLRNLKNSTYLMQSRKDATWRVQFAWEQSQSEWTQWQFAYADGSWTIQNKLSSDNGGGDSYYLGAWNSQKWVDGEVLAGNKSGNDVGHFKIYQIARDTYNAKTKQNATDVTSLITNPSFDNGGTFTATKANAVGTTIPGWTITGGNYQYYSVAYSGQGNSVRDNNSGFGKTVRGAEGKQYIGTRLTWQPSETSMAQTLSNLPEGEYTLSVACKGATPSSTAPSLTIKATPVTGSIGGVKKTFPTGKTRNNTAYTFEDNYGDWTRLSYVFNVTSAGNVVLNLAMNNNTTGNNNNGNDEVVIDDLNLTYKNYTASLESAIDRAALLYARTSDSDLSTAIENAQSVLDNVDNTTNYQTTINSAVTVLRSVINTTYAKVEFASGEDITFLLENASFESGEALPANVTTSFNNINSTDVYVKMQPLEGWTIGSAEENITAGVFEYGMDYGISGYTANNIETPVTGHSNAVVMLAGWGAKTQYTQDVTLPAGRYSITVPVYNKGGATAFSKNLIGFIEKGGTEHLATTKNYSVGSWITSTIEFDLNTETDGYMSVGYTSVSGQGSGNMPRLYVDGFTITYTDAANAYDQTKTAATETLGLEIYANVVGTERIDLQTLLNADVSEYTVAQYFTAIDNINAAVATFTAAKTNYDALVAEIAKAKALGIDATTADGYAATPSSTAATALTNTQSLKVAEYTFITGTYTQSATLGTWTEDFAQDLNGEGYVSNGSNYFNEWGTNTRTAKQTVKLPAGNYAVSCIGRGAVGTSGYLYYKIGDADAVTTDFNMKGNRGKGVDTDGVANFSDDGTYTCDDAGFGWEYRFLTFTLSEEAEVEIGVSATFANNWVSIYAPQLRTTEASVKALRLTEISTAIDNVPTGKMNATVASTLATKKTVAEGASDSNTLEELETILNELNDAIDAAETSVTAYATVKTAIDDAKAVSLTGSTLDIATYETAYNEGSIADEDVETTIAGIKAALRTALLAQTPGSEITPLLINPSFENGNDAWNSGWTTNRGTTGNFDYKIKTTSDETADEGLLDGANVLNAWAPQIEYINVTQTLSLPVGVYRLTASAYSDRIKNQHIAAKVGSTTYESSVLDGAVWQTLSVKFSVATEGNVTVGIYSNGNNLNNDTYGWFRADNFQLYYLGQVETKTSSANLQGYKTFYNADLNYEADENTDVYIAAAPSNGYVSLTKMADRIIPAGTPVILKTSNQYDITLTPTTASSSNDFSANVLEVATSAGTINGAYILAYTKADGLGFYNYTGSLDAGDVYLTAAAGSNVRLSIVADGETTGIAGVDAEAGKDTEAIYNMAGQRVDGSYKGIVIKNGKKILVK